jgi:hypothetical protein
LTQQECLEVERGINPRMVLEIRAAIRESTAAQMTLHRGQMAFGRSGHHNQRAAYYLWWAGNSAGNVLDVLLQRHRDTKAAARFFRKLLKK